MKTTDILIKVIKSLQDELEAERFAGLTLRQQNMELRDKLEKVTPDVRQAEIIDELTLKLKNSGEWGKGWQKEAYKYENFYNDTKKKLETANWYLKDFQKQLANYEKIVIPEYQKEETELKTNLQDSIDIFLDVVKVATDKQSLINELQGKIKELTSKWQKSETDKIEILQAGYARK